MAAAMWRSILTGAAAGAAGTTALNASTYVDMVARGRPASSTPEDTVERLADHVPGGVPGEGEARDNRVSGLGPLLGVVTGVAVGAAYGLFSALAGRPRVAVGALGTGLVAMAGANLPMAAFGVSDPRSWPASSWVSDALPHLAYGLVTAATYEAAQPRRRA